MIVLNKVKSYFEGYDDIQHDFGWTEFTLKELGLPTAEEILNGVNQITNVIDLQGWRTKHGINETYKGFGLTYNPTFVDKTEGPTQPITCFDPQSHVPHHLFNGNSFST